MPEAAGAVAAAAVADRMHAPKEDRHLAIVLVCYCCHDNLIQKISKVMCISPLSRKLQKWPSFSETPKRPP
jgi:hypothetical protein